MNKQPQCSKEGAKCRHNDILNGEKMAPEKKKGNCPKTIQESNEIR